MNVSVVNFTSSEVNASSDLTSQQDVFLYYATVGVFSFNLTFWLPTYSYVLWLIATGRRIASEFLLFNLAVCVIIYTLNSLVCLLLIKFAFLIEVQVFLQGLSVTSRPVFECLICAERYLAVVHPVTFLKFKPLRYRAICSAVVWLASLCLCLYLNTIITSSQNAFMCFYSVQYLLFFSVQLFLLLAVLRALRQSGPGERGREKEENNMKRRAFNLILISTANMVFMFTPYIITGFFTVLTHRNGSVGFVISLGSFSLGTLVHPVIYLHRVGKISCCRSS